MSRLLKLGADPSKLYDQFRQREEERREGQEDVQLRAENKVTEHIVGPEYVSIADYRRAKKASQSAVFEPYLDTGDFSFRDWKAWRRAQQRGERPLVLRPEIVAEVVKAPTPTADQSECDLMAYREEREQEG